MSDIRIKKESFDANNVFFSEVQFDNLSVLRVEKDPIIKADDEATYARLLNYNFQNGIIEVQVLSKLLSNAPAHARGFIGIAFRISESNDNFECIYIRPTNGRAKDQLRRNRSVQYFSYPDFKYDRLRVDSPGQYETYVDIDLDEWIDLKVIVNDDNAKLFVNNSNQPTLIVNELKHGANNEGFVGLWVDVGTEGFFRDLKITKL